MAKVIFAKQGASDGRYRVHTDQPVFADSEVAKLHPDWFVELPAELRDQVRRAAPVVEDASAAPGAKRTIAKK